MNSKQLLNLKFYYSNYKLHNFFIKFLHNRETVILSPKSVSHNYAVRNMRIHNTQAFQFWLRYLRMFQDSKHTYNFYYSMATFEKGVPYRDTSEGLLKQNFDQWNKDAPKSITKYDMLIDIDAGDFDEIEHAQETAVILQKVFINNNVPFHVRFSGMGFHFIIPSRYFPVVETDPEAENNIYQLMRRYAEYLNSTFSEMIDTTIYDSRRITKLPMSVSCYPEYDLVCTPLRDVRDFDFNDVILENFKYNASIYEDTLCNPEGNLQFFKNAEKRNYH